MRPLKRWLYQELVHSEVEKEFSQSGVYKNDKDSKRKSGQHFATENDLILL
jgi:hypothetical protein